MVFALAGDSTITSFFAISRATLASGRIYAILAAGGTVSAPLRALLLRGRSLVAARAPRLPLQGARTGAFARLRRLRAGGRARLEPRPVAARVRPVAEAVPALHGEVGALLVPAR